MLYSQCKGILLCEIGNTIQNYILYEMMKEMGVTSGRFDQTTIQIIQW